MKLLCIVMTAVLVFACETNEQIIVEKEAVSITEAEIIETQKIWGNGIVRISKLYNEGGDYKTAAKEHINELYGYNLGEVLFKPTLAADEQFRTDFEGALSYFVGGNENYPEDNGFAIKGWTNVKWENTGIISEGNMAVAMGNYYFTTSENEDVKVEYSFAYTKDNNNKLRIILHHSSKPYIK